MDFVQDKIQFSDKIKAATNDIIVQVLIKMDGTTLKPKFSVQKVNLKKGNLVESIGDQAVSTLETARDSIKNTIIDTIASTRDMIKHKIDSTSASVITKIDSARTEISEKIDTTIASLEEVIRTEQEDILQEGSVLIDSIKAGNVDSLLHNIEDLFGKKKGKLDSLKTNIPFDLFQKKKKNGGSK